MKCSVKNCLRNQGDRSGTNLHKLPENDEVANIWKINLNRGDAGDRTETSTDIFVCSDHFSDNCFVTNDDGVPTNELLPSAVPSIFPWMKPKRKRKASNEASSDSSAMKIVVKRTTENKWKINDENSPGKKEDGMGKEEATDEKQKPQPIVLRMRRKKKKHLRQLQAKNKYVPGNVYKTMNQVQANAIKMKYRMNRRNKIVDNAAKNHGILIDPHKFSITVPYGCRLCSFMAKDICSYVMHVKIGHSCVDVVPSPNDHAINDMKMVDDEIENTPASLVSEKGQNGEKIFEEKSPQKSDNEKSDVSPLSKKTSAKLDKIVTNLLTIKQDISDSLSDSAANTENDTEQQTKKTVAKVCKNLLTGVNMAELESVKKFCMTKETVAIFEEAFETFPYLTEEEYSSLSSMTGVMVKHIEAVFHAARLKQGISWEVHQIKAAAMALGKQKLP